MAKRTDFDYHYFDDIGDDGYRGYRRQMMGNGAIEVWELAARICIKHGVKSVLDLGCAKGFLVEALLVHAIEAKGCDLSDYALSFAPRPECFRHDIRAGIPSKAECIAALGILIYLTLDELEIFLAQVNQLAPKLFLFSAHFEGDRQLVHDPLRKITRPALWWRRKIESAGFTRLTDEGYFFVFSRDS